MRRLMLPLATVLLSSAVAYAADPPFEVDQNHTVFGFTAHTLLFDVPGRFHDYKAEITGDPANPASARIRIEIDAKSVDTDNDRRDKHLRSADFFDVEKHPRLIFESTRVSRDGATVTVAGKLTMHGVTQPVVIPFTVVEALNGAGIRETAYRGTLRVSNKAFGIGADSVAAKISLLDETDIQLVIAGFWPDRPAAPASGKK